MVRGNRYANTADTQYLHQYAIVYSSTQLSVGNVAVPMLQSLNDSKRPKALQLQTQLVLQAVALHKANCKAKRETGVWGETNKGKPGHCCVRKIHDL